LIAQVIKEFQTKLAKFKPYVAFDHDFGNDTISKGSEMVAIGKCTKFEALMCKTWASTKGLGKVDARYSSIDKLMSNAAFAVKTIAHPVLFKAVQQVLAKG
jgi:hypothetical protein